MVCQHANLTSLRAGMLRQTTCGGAPSVSSTGSREMKDVARGNNGRGGGRAIHPGSGRRKAAPFPRGRVLRQEEVDAVRALLGDRPRERALLIEYLHLIQDSEGCLPAGQLHALA